MTTYFTSDRLLPSQWPYDFLNTFGCNVAGLQRAEFQESISQPDCRLYNAGGINPGSTNYQVHEVMFSGNNPAEHETRARLKQVLPAPWTLKLVVLQENLARSLFIQAHCVWLPFPEDKASEVCRSSAGQWFSNRDKQGFCVTWITYWKQRFSPWGSTSWRKGMPYSHITIGEPRLIWTNFASFFYSFEDVCAESVLFLRSAACIP